MTSPHIAVDDGIARGDGPVVIELGADRITGASVAADLDARTAVVTEGVWKRGESELSFELGGFDLATGIGRVTGGVFQGGHTELRAGDMAWFDDGRIAAEQVWATTCACNGPPPLSISTRRLELVPDEYLAFGSGWVRVFDVPILPVPAGRLPLSRQSGFLAPVVGNGQDGLRVKLPLYLTLGEHADLTLTPAIRTQRSARLLSEFRYALRGGQGQLDASYGYDSQLYLWRGSLSAEHQWARGPWNTAVDADYVTDVRQFRDYGDAFLDRSQPWAEQRALAGYKSLEAGYNGFRTETDLAVIPSIGWSVPRTDVGAGVLVGGQALYQPWLARQSGGGGQAIAAVDAQRPTWTGPLRWTPRVAAARVANKLGRNDTRLHSGLELAMPLWRLPSKGFETVEPFADAGVTRALRRGDWERLDALGAGLRYRRTVAGRGVYSEARVERSAQGWAGEGALRAQAGPLFAWGQSRFTPDEGPVLGTAGAAVDNGRHRLASGWVWAGDRVHQVYGDAAWTLPGKLDPLRISAGVRTDLANTDWMSRWGGLRYTHPSGCLAVGAVARFDSDRRLPDVHLDFEIAPPTGL